MSNLSRAQTYVSAGLVVIPIPPGQKYPAQKDWSHRGIRDWLGCRQHWIAQPNDGIGVILGESGLVSLDIDQTEYSKIILSEFAIELDELIAQTPTIQGKPDRYRLEFKAPSGVPLGRKVIKWPHPDGKSDPITVLELRAGPVQDVFPPTIHPITKEPYKWITGTKGGSGQFPDLPEVLLNFWLNWDVFKKNAEALCPWAAPKAPEQHRQRQEPRGTGDSPIEAWNGAHRLEDMLEAKGYKRIGKRYLSPSSTTGIPGIRQMPGGKWYNSHGSGCLPTDSPIDAFDVFCYHDHGGDRNTALKHAAELLGLGRQTNGHSAPLETIGNAALKRELRNNPQAAQTMLTPPLDVFSKPPLPALAPQHLPIGLATYVFDQSEIIGSDPCILAISTLVVCAGCIHDGVKLQVRRNDTTWKESARLWGAFVGDPSSKKTPSVARALSHARKIDMLWREENEKALKDFAIEDKIFEKRKAAYIHESAKEQGHAPKMPKEPDRPRKLRLIAEDTTIEALGLVLADNNRGIILHRDELSGWFGSMDAYNNGTDKDRAMWLEAYNGGPKAIDRVKHEQAILIPNWSVSLVGGIQPTAMRKVCGKLQDDGLLQRFMIVMATEPETNGIDREPDRAATQTYWRILETLVKTEWTEQPYLMSVGASEVREALEAELRLVRRMGGITPKMNAHIGKWDGLYARLCLAYHLIEAAARDELAGPEISAETATRVSAFLREYLFPHMSAFYGEIIQSNDYYAHVRWIAGHILAKGLQELENRTLLQNYKQWKNLPEWDRERVIRCLEDSGWLVPVLNENMGKKTTKWAVNLMAHETFKDRAEQEAATRKGLQNALLASVMAKYAS